MAKNEQFDPLNLDSLVDILTCTVGVLMIIMTTSQVWVLGQKSITDEPEKPLPQVRQADVNIRENELKQLKKELEKTRDQWGLLEADYPGNLSQISEMAENIRRLNESMSQDENTPGKVESGRKEKAQLEGRKKELLKQIEEIYSKNMQLQKQIDMTPKATEIALTETRIVPTDLNSVTFICRRGRIYRMDSDEIGEVVVEAVKEIVASVTSSMPESERIDLFVNYFKKHDVGNSLFRVKVTHTIFGPFRGFTFTIEPRSITQGETVEELSSAGSKFRSAVSRIRPEKEYIRFAIWPDSFDVYAAAQQIATDIHKVEGQYKTKIGISWTAYDFDEEIKDVWIPGIDTPRSKGTIIIN